MRCGAATVCSVPAGSEDHLYSSRSPLLMKGQCCQSVLLILFYFFTNGTKVAPQLSASEMGLETV